MACPAFVLWVPKTRERAHYSHRLIEGAIMTKTALLLALGCTLAIPAEARVTKIIIDKKVSPAFDGASFGSAGQYETLAGRAFGELDPNDPLNAIITDIKLAARNANGKVEYIATFFLVKPIDLSKSSHLLWEEVPNRGGRITLGIFERNLGDIGLSTGWQGDNAGATAQSFPNANDFVIAPVARNADGSPIIGKVLGRIFNVRGVDSQPLIVYNNPVPYTPVDLDTAKATIVAREAETIDGRFKSERKIASTDWAWARCSASNPFPGTPDPTRICLRDGFNPAFSYYVTFTAKDPYVLAVGFAAFRDVASFFKNDVKDDPGTPNPLAGSVQWVIARGRSQSGNFLKAFLLQGFNRDEKGRQVHDGSWPIISSGPLSLNVRFGMPDGVTRLYSFGREGSPWWMHTADEGRNRAANGILDRCTATHTCPKIVETFGSAEMWYLKMAPALVGTSGKADIPLPANVRRYYISSTPHGGGPGGFNTMPLAVPTGNGLNWGRCALPANPMPFNETSNAIEAAFRNWVMHDGPMPPSRYPTLASHTLATATKQGLGFPSIPGLAPTAPDGLMNPVLDYDFGSGFDATDGRGVVSNVMPSSKHVINLPAPKVDADGNELGGVPVVLREAPLGTYLGWNITAEGIYKDEICSFTGGMVPFAATKAEREANGDPRLSLEERYHDHAGYVSLVKAAAAKAVSEGFLLEPDAARLVEQASASNVLVR
jgi:hypothetical protein